METQTLVKKINLLPLLEKKEVGDFVDFLLFKSKNAKNKVQKERVFGFFKNKMKISANFDDPIDDFEKYTQ